MKFTWDPTKAEVNLKKHGISFEEASTVFDDVLAVVRPDQVHPERSVIIGMSMRARVLLCVHVELEEDETRIISARGLTRRERKDHEEGN